MIFAAKAWFSGAVNGSLQASIASAGIKEPWIVRKTRTVASLEHKPLDSLLVTAADKAHIARDMVLDARRDHGGWERLLDEAMDEILRSTAYERIVPRGITLVVWSRATWSGRRRVQSRWRCDRPGVKPAGAAAEDERPAAAGRETGLTDTTCSGPPGFWGLRNGTISHFDSTHARSR